jgi:ferrous iron transport protein A
VQHPNANATMPLTMTQRGERVEVVTITAGHKAMHRLAEMGIIPGATLEIVQGQRGCPLLLAIRDTRLAIERGIASKVLVQPAVSQHHMTHTATPYVCAP